MPLPDPDLPPQPLLDAELRRIVMSRAFRASRRHQRLLTYLVRHCIDGQAASLKESVLAAEVFDSQTP